MADQMERGNHSILHCEWINSGLFREVYHFMSQVQQACIEEHLVAWRSENEVPCSKGQCFSRSNKRTTNSTTQCLTLTGFRYVYFFLFQKDPKRCCVNNNNQTWGFKALFWRQLNITISWLFESALLWRSHTQTGLVYIFLLKIKGLPWSMHYYTLCWKTDLSYIYIYVWIMWSLSYCTK